MLLASAWLDTSCQQRKGDMIYRLVDTQTKKVIDDGRVIAAKECPLRNEGFPSTRLRWLPNFLEGSNGRSEADVPRNGGICGQQRRQIGDVGLSRSALALNDVFHRRADAILPLL